MIQEIVVYILIVSAVGFAVSRLIRTLRNKGGCGCGCEGCKKNGCQQKTRLPEIDPDSLG